MNVKRSMGMFVPFDINIMTYSVLKDIVDEESSEGLGAAAALLLHLDKFPSGIAKLRSTNVVAAQIHKKNSYLRHIINDYRMFRLTPDGQSFYSPYLREIMRLKPYVETADDVGRRVEIKGEKFKKRGMRMFVPVDINFMTYEPVDDIVSGEGANGLGAVMALLLYLLQFKGCTAKLRDVNIVAAQLHKKPAFILHIVTDYRMFCLTPDGLSFYSPYLCEAMGLETRVNSADAVDMQVTSRSTALTDAVDMQVTSRSTALTNVNRNGESADNQAVSASTIYINDIEDKKDKYINIKNNSSSTSNKKISGEIFSEEDEKSFLKKEINDEVTPAPVKSRRRRGQSAEEAQMTIEQKIERVFADKEWVTSLYKSHRLGFNPNLNQWGPFCMGVVKEWMANEVRVKRHGDKSVSELQGYAYNLLRPESRTRQEFDDCLGKEREKEAERREKEGFEYEMSEEEKIADEKWKKEYAEYEENFWRGVREAREREKCLKAAAERDRLRSEEQRLRGIPYHYEPTEEEKEEMEWRRQFEQDNSDAQDDAQDDYKAEEERQEDAGGDGVKDAEAGGDGVKDAETGGGGNSEEEEKEDRPYMEDGLLYIPETFDWNKLDGCGDEDWAPEDKNGRRYFIGDLKKEEDDIPYLEAGALYVSERFDWIKIDSYGDEVWGPEDKNGRRYFIGDLKAVTL